MNARAMPVKPQVWNRQVLMGASAAALGWAVSTAALALPANPTIFANSPFVGTAATFTPGTGTLTVTQNADRVVIDWDSFNISSGETVTFVQGQDNFIAFNRIDPAAFTTIDGNLFGNGSVWLFSPGGILFGANAQVNVGSFFAGLGALDDFQANESVGLTDLSVFVNFGNAENLNTLTVNPGAQIFSNGSGFVVLQASHLEIAGGEIGGAQSQVGFIVAEGGTVDFRQGVANPDGWELAAAHQASDPSGRGQPILHHYADTTADWIVIESAQFTESNFESVINLDGSMTVTGADPSNGDGIHVWGGTDTTADIVNGEITNITASGQFTSVGDVSLDATEVYVTGDVVTSGDFEAFAYSILQVNVDTSIYAGGDVGLHSHGDIADIRIKGIVHADAIVDIWSTSADTLTTIEGNVSAGGQVRIRSGGDVVIRYSASITGDTDGDGLLNGIGVFIASGAGLNTPANTYYLGDGDLVIEDGATIIGAGTGPQQQVMMTGHYGTIDIDGDVSGSRIVVRANDVITISGALTATDEIVIGGGTAVRPATGDDIVISGTAVLEANDRILVFNAHGDIAIESGALLQSDADGVPTTAIVPHAYADDAIVLTTQHHLVVEAGATLDAGNNFAYFYANGFDSGPALADAAMTISGDVEARTIIGYAYNGSIVVSGDLHATQDIYFYAVDAFVLTSGATLTADAPLNGSPPYFADDAFAGVKVGAGDVAIAGDITAAAIAFRGLSGSDDMVIGGDDGIANVGAYELGGQFNLSNDEFQNLHGQTLVFIGGADNSNPNPLPDSDVSVLDLTIDASVVDTLVFGTGSLNAVDILGDLTPTLPGVVDLWVGVVQDQSPFTGLTGFIPGQINILGSIGSATNPFAHVSLLATGDIFMGSEDFILAAINDDDFNANLPNDLDVDEGHIFIAADSLTLFGAGRIIQQNTGTQGDFAGLLIGEPVQGMELISADPSLDGAVIGGPDGYIISLESGPITVQLFGVFTGTTPVEGRDVAENPWLLSSTLEDNVQYTINGCQFGGFSCGGASEVPQFATPTEIAMVDIPPADEAPADQASADPDSEASADEEASDEAAAEEEAAEEQAASEDPDSELFRTLVAPGADRAYEQQRIGEPITGSGNEDLWTGHGDGVRP